MAKFTDYTEKTEPVDTDLALIYDTPAKVNKKFTFGNLWKWIAKKIVSEGISQLETTNKTIPGAINELNSNTQFMLQTSSKNKNNINIVINSRCSIILLLNNYSGYLAVYAIEIDSQYNCSQIEIINKKQIKPIITVDNKILTISENAWISALILSTIPITEIK
ncbi:hypothetical protein [Blautia sp. AM47-4]|jgi:hypothetical protein|uniref:hypothetical protein n=1 Tax=Blautia sp. AM47-4 TaxID=2292979 RepID=UPI000E5D7D70|nr:hypothetical protein [Blautia sp. AM47-4]RHS44920.1 hypothetical protein DW965_14430 [Blautia sp. AM47-4]